MAKGSHATWAGWEPRTCTTCGRKLTLDDVFMAHFDHVNDTASICCGDCLLYPRPDMPITAPRCP